jgi:hypothetical protein
VYVGDTTAMQAESKAARVAYRRAVKNRLIARYEVQGRSPSEAAELAEELIAGKQVDHAIDMQVSGALKNPHGRDNLHMLDGSTNASIGKQLQLEAERLGLKAGDTIDEIEIIAPPYP